LNSKEDFIIKVCSLYRYNKLLGQSENTIYVIDEYTKENNVLFKSSSESIIDINIFEKNSQNDKNILVVFFINSVRLFSVFKTKNNEEIEYTLISEYKRNDNNLFTKILNFQ